ncbi:TAF8 [Cordylochernes scorpioides]|uniref:Transcription initiation factor TFIID subunit 8 n=1 Tax=Cordylochernes scorpioides TaxID=51811 RepID=A0ABY6K8A1_9ARAC|nr:TAF8 [Cordylochernes scorpioides]
MVEVGRSSRAYCEHAGRCEPIVNDVAIAMIEMVSKVKPPIQPKTLQAGIKPTLPSYIPDYYPPFPDPHAYIRTPTHKQPMTEYEGIREKAASQKRDLDRALSRFIAKTGTKQAILPDDPTSYPLVSCKPHPNPYLEALLPKDQEFQEEDEANKKKKKAAPEPPEPKPQEGSADIDNPYLRSVKLPRKRKR